ncbi:MAG: 50S ribosomal protein L11 methyltransferase [Proteobacteria bacterium]|nr:50S ribosomal protein L11 methyltransferase [Pseudomonadota bacterium]
MQWINVTASARREELDALETWFWDQGAVSVTVEDGKDNPIFEPPPGETPLWEEVLVTGLFEEDLDLPALELRLNEAQFQLVAATHLEDRPWEREWLTRFEPMKFGERLWVCPTGFELDPVDKIVMHLDPGLAFGTGTHETTRLCLEFMDGLSLSGKSVIDYGCGSGILAIAAGLMGADPVVGIDNDHQALVATEANADRNGVHIETGMPGKSLEAADLVVANILAQPLVELAGMLAGLCRPGGLLVLSGIMSSQAEWVGAAYRDRMNPVDQTELNGWIRQVWRAN